MNPNEPAQADINGVFSVPLVIAHHPSPEALNSELRELFLRCTEEGDKHRNPTPFVYRNEALYESNFSLFDWPQPAAQKLREFCLTQLYQTVGELNGYGVDVLQKMHYSLESWFHVTRKGGFFGAHNHPNHSWSGVYCVAHDGDDPASDSGKLVFLNPHATSTMYIDWATKNLKHPFSRSPLMLRLKPGQLVLFPSWLQHEVLPYEGDNLRITVAFNARFRYSGEDVRRHAPTA
ncbi:MAG: hypothetical protein GVY32_09825 [Gammaproteobacteria bacterium]|jgi:uncharacterized protein (TIGR02466 family)|nr:hypothetical protein [Gammaproteobacteria bacterium]